MDGVAQKALLQIKLVKISRSLQAKDINEVGKIKSQIKAIEENQLSLLAPKNFDPTDPENYIRGMEKSFESLIATLEDLGVKDPKRLTVFEFYSRYEFYKKKNKPKKPTANG